MMRLGIAAGLTAVAALGLWRGAVWLREDAVRDFMREAAVAAAEKRQADQATKDRIETEIGNATIDQLRERALSGGMFTD